MENYKEDKDFVSAIKEDYDVILKTLDFQIRLLEELESLDKYNPFLKKHSTAELKESVRDYIKESAEFNDELEKDKLKDFLETPPQIKTDNNESEKNTTNDKNSVYI